MTEHAVQSGNPKYFMPASLIGYAVLVVAFSHGSVWIGFVNLCFAGVSIVFHGLFLGEGSWATKKTGDVDVHVGSILVTCLFIVGLSYSLPGIFIDANRLYVESEIRTKISSGVGITAAALMFVFDYYVVRRQNSLRRRLILLLCITLAILLIWVVAAACQLTGATVSPSIIWDTRLASKGEIIKYHASLIFPLVWPIVPAIVLLLKLARGPEPETETQAQHGPNGNVEPPEVVPPLRID